VKPYYSDDLVTIYHGDCREWMPEADVIVTDPPYGIGYVGRRRRGTAITGDDEPFDPAHLIEAHRPTVLFGAVAFAARLPASAGWIVWDKVAPHFDRRPREAELAWTNFLTSPRILRVFWTGGINYRNEHGTDAPLHPAQKPVALMTAVLGITPSGSVLDPYMGSGSTLLAAKQCGRKSIGIEIEERYCEIAAARCSQEVLGLVV
jgi:DNA modification methylase